MKREIAICALTALLLSGCSKTYVISDVYTGYQQKKPDNNVEERQYIEKDKVVYESIKNFPDPSMRTWSYIDFPTKPYYNKNR